MLPPVSPALYPMRRNYRGSRVRLAGLSTAIAVIATAGGARARIVAGIGAAAGACDDLVLADRETAADKGLRGHLAAARVGRLTGGQVKAVVNGAAAWWAVGPAATTVPDRMVRAAAMAGTAHALNLFDLRPGRALKVALLVGVPFVGDRSSAAVAGVVAATLRADLSERSMLGDTGVGAIGAVLGLRLATGSASRATAAAGVGAALALLAERLSFSAVINSCPPLRWLDQLGGVAR